MRKIPAIIGASATLFSVLSIAVAVHANSQSDPNHTAWWDLAILREVGDYLAYQTYLLFTRLDSSGGQNPFFSGTLYHYTTFAVSSICIGLIVWASTHVVFRIFCGHDPKRQNEEAEQDAPDRPL
ncbi:hypothetical protein ACFQY0_20755 [Haloferula chungangensis]|uniref:Uncharacterized protein n=1 Tax=Haloferula chungangensis TaxID=1048331 RepID=A0ABW2LF47_9BACT